ncbi:MAG TPA: sigma 54-interacting transcriptional regulator [Puia sp.]|nr:sigma 54-interacting transcriptional regulator [Puia sp.]
MESLLQTIALITAGLSLAMGSISLMAGLYKDGEKIDLLFGIMCLFLFIFFVIPPVGFIVLDKAPYPVGILLKRLFNFSYAGMFPWLISCYTGYKKKGLPVLIDALILSAYFFMFFTTTESLTPFWFYIILIPLGLIFVHSCLGIQFQYKSGEKTKAKWLILIMTIYLLLYIPTAVNQVSYNYFGKLIHAKLFYPINLFPITFILLMGMRLRSHTQDKIRLERLLAIKNLQWDLMMKNMQIFIVQIDLEGTIHYINPYAVKLLGFNDASDVMKFNWFKQILPGDESEKLQIQFQQLVQYRQLPQNYKSEIINTRGERILMNWNNLLLNNDKGLPDGVLAIGTNITETENFILQIQELKAELEKENLALKGETAPEWMEAEIVGTSQAIKYVIRKAKQVASTTASVLLEGETGVGKELFADLIHRHSLRSASTYIKVNCGALPTELVEDELFGHEKGAFTGAVQVRKGRFEMADGGTIFLDEIGELPLPLQPKLLRVLQSGEFERIGGQQTFKVDVRVIAATNRMLSEEVKEGRFREDLYYRLNVFPITVPPLRNRREDLPALIQYYIEKKARKHGKSITQVSKSDMNYLLQHDWPGNIRQLKNVIERAVISSVNGILKIEHAMLEANKIPGQSRSTSSLENIERNYILKVLQECNWQIAGPGGAAEILTINSNTLRSRMKKLNISRQSSGGS